MRYFAFGLFIAGVIYTIAFALDRGVYVGSVRAEPSTTLGRLCRYLTLTRITSVAIEATEDCGWFAK